MVWATFNVKVDCKLPQTTEIREYYDDQLSMQKGILTNHRRSEWYAEGILDF